MLILSQSNIELKNKKIAVVIPVKKFNKSKTRLNQILDEIERENLSKILTKDLIIKLSRINEIQIIIVTNEIDTIKSIIKDDNYNLVFINENKSSGVNNSIKMADEYLRDKNLDASIIIPIDLPLLKTKDIKKIINISKKMTSGICIVPSQRRDGTNILLRKPNSIINTHYDMDSFNNHVNEAQRNNKVIKILKYENLTIDLDTPEDINSILKMYRKNRPIETNESIEFLLQIVTNKSLKYEGFQKCKIKE